MHIFNVSYRDRSGVVNIASCDQYSRALNILITHLHRYIDRSDGRLTVSPNVKEGVYFIERVMMNIDRTDDEMDVMVAVGWVEQLLEQYIKEKEKDDYASLRKIIAREYLYES